MDLAADREKGAVARAGDLEVALLLARVVHRHQVFAAILDPFHRAIDVARRERDQEILGIEFAARAIAAADVVLDHVDLLDRQADLRRQDAAVEERHFRRAIDREPARGIVPCRHDAARLHRQPVVAAGAKLLAADVGRVGEGRVGVALARLEHQRAVGAGLLEQQLLVLRRRLPVGDRGQVLDLDFDRFQRVLADGDADDASTTAIGSPT